MNESYTVPPERAGFEPLVSWLARLVVDEFLAEERGDVPIPTPAPPAERISLPALLTREEIATQAIERWRFDDFGSGPGVYFLLVDADVVYIGASAHLAGRIRQHSAKPHTRIHAVRCERAFELEVQYILAMQPVWNEQRFARRARRLSGDVA